MLLSRGGCCVSWISSTYSWAAAAAAPGLPLRAPGRRRRRFLDSLYVLLGGNSENGPAPGAIETAKDLEVPTALKALNLPAGSKLATLAERCGGKLK